MIIVYRCLQIIQVSISGSVYLLHHSDDPAMVPLSPWFTPGRKHGEGTLCEPNGRVYRGQWRDGKRRDVAGMGYSKSSYSGNIMDRP